MELFRNLQQLIGEVERVTDLVDLLNKVDAQKAADLSNSVQAGDCIEFEGCGTTASCFVTCHFYLEGNDDHFTQTGLGQTCERR
jgi:hypothetical protein